MKFKFYLSSLILLLTTFMMVNAQNNTVNGKITDGVDGLSGVNVIIQGTNTGVSTDDNGVFILSSDKDLPWTLEISSIGFQGQNLVVNSTSQVISISLSSGEELDEVVISGSRKPEKSINAASSITVIGTKEIENKSVFNSLSLVDDVAGLQVDRQGANKLNITLRDDVDLLTTSTLVMQDYRALNLTGVDVFDSNASNLSSIDLERVEVVLGPASALYGPGVGAGVVHFLSKDPFKYPGTTLQIQGGAISNGGSMLSKGNFNMYNMNFKILKEKKLMKI
ncbi:MAG: carboxypeptidase-like regulatory domain-containing protein [Pelagibacterales bacterium]|nr:carboxypeptidase-like regulatory domain-containing protein [Pelagibacterales bacterium]